MRIVLITCLALSLPLAAAETPRVFPLWDGHESVASYAKRVNLPPTKSLDLGKGVTLDLVLIPAGQFMMGSSDPVPPSATIEEALALFCVGTILIIALFIYLHFRYAKIHKRHFSLGWLMLRTASVGLFVGGLALSILVGIQEHRYNTAIRPPRDEIPEHKVTLTQPFYMGKYTVTQPQYEAVMGSNPSHFKGAQLPVESVTWNNSIAFCRKLSDALHINAKLPGEAQWEYACRAGTQTCFYSGDKESDLADSGWYSNNGGFNVHPVGLKKPNLFGLYDMHGNVCQWCQDWYGAVYYKNSPERDPMGPMNGEYRILRAGSMSYRPSACSSACRIQYEANTDYFIFGFRIIVTPDF